MSIKIMSQVWANGPEDKAMLLVLLALSDFADDQGNCWPSMESIASKARMSERNARRVIRALEVSGYLTTDEGGGRHGCNKYVINPDNVTPGQNVLPGQNEQETRTKRAGNPDIAMSAEPSRTVKNRQSTPLYPPEPKPPPKSRLPEDWVLSDKGWAYAREQGIPDGAITDEANGFHAYWSDRTGPDARKSERGWEQCWNGWCRRIAPRYRNDNVARRAQPGGRGQGGSIASIAAKRAADRGSGLAPDI